MTNFTTSKLLRSFLGSGTAIIAAGIPFAMGSALITYGTLAGMSNIILTGAMAILIGTLFALFIAIEKLIPSTNSIEERFDAYIEAELDGMFSDLGKNSSDPTTSERNRLPRARTIPGKTRS